MQSISLHSKGRAARLFACNVRTCTRRFNAAKLPVLAAETLGSTMPADLGVPPSCTELVHLHTTWFTQNDGTGLTRGEFGDPYLKDFEGPLRTR